jgi:hypothetical protein
MEQTYDKDGWILLLYWVCFCEFVLFSTIYIYATMPPELYMLLTPSKNSDTISSQVLLFNYSIAFIAVLVII